MADQFTPLRLRWIEALVRDLTVTPFACRVGVILATGYVSRKDFKINGELLAWPSQKTLAGKVGGTEDGIRSGRRDADF